jgi:hypothetical protein
MNKNNWEITTKRFVVFLDVMGFKDFIMRNDAQIVYDRMKELSYLRDDIPLIVKTNNPEQYREVYSTTFSDSIVLFSNDDSVESLGNLLYMSRATMTSALMLKIPIKGSIAYGEISVDREKQIFCGQPIIYSYELQEDLHYYGVVFHNSVDRFINNKCQGNRDIEQSYFKAKTFFKSGIITHNNLDIFINEVVGGEQFDYEELEILMESVSGSPRKYIDNTIAMKKALREQCQ